MRWFHRESGTLIPRFTSRELSQDDVHRRTPILTGRPQTNPLIRKMMSSPHAAHLGYRIHSSRGTVKIDDIDMGERQALAQFVISKEGVVGPVTGMGFVFGIVSRIRNPSGYGHVTIVACDYYPMVIARIVELLTSEKHARSLLERMGWRLEDELPDSFEILFKATLSPGNLEGEGYPQFVSWRFRADEVRG